MQGKLEFTERKLARRTDPRTSKLAANVNKIAKNTQRFLILREFVMDKYAGGNGIADENAAIRAQIPRIDAGHKRAAELRRDGFIEVVGEIMGKYGTPVRICTATAHGCSIYESSNRTDA
jgi:hypothetical protein